MKGMKLGGGGGRLSEQLKTTKKKGVRNLEYQNSNILGHFYMTLDTTLGQLGFEF